MLEILRGNCSISAAMTVIVASLFATQCQDRNWLPRPDLNLLSWGFGFLIINGIISIPAGAFFFMEAKSVYDELLDREEAYIEKYEEAIMQNAENTVMAVGYDPSVVAPGMMMGNSFATQASFGPGMSYYDGTGQMGFAPGPDMTGMGYGGVAYPMYGYPVAPAYAAPSDGYYTNANNQSNEPYKVSDLPDEQVPEYIPQGPNSYYPTTEQGYSKPPLD